MPMIDRDTEHLRILTICQYIHAGVCALYSLFPIFHLLIGLAIVLAPKSMCPSGQSASCPPDFFGWFFVIIAASIMLLGFSLAFSMFLTGRFMGRRQHWLACVIMSGVQCILMPTGTVLGIFCIVVLTRPSVKRMFGVPLSKSETALLQLSDPEVLSAEQPVEPANNSEAEPEEKN